MLRVSLRVEIARAKVAELKGQLTAENVAAMTEALEAHGAWDTTRRSSRAALIAVCEKGWLNNDGLTEAGKAALAAFDEKLH